jgi:murein DD-endopeptidase MepM/ murein hydrolase activator NlpD
MLKKILFFTLLLSCQFVIGQQAIDTVDTEKGRIVFFTNRTWQFLKDKSFDGILNRRIHDLVKRDSLNFKQPWDNEVCYTSLRHNDMSRLKDTIWLCVLEEEHSKFHFPVDGIVTSRYGFRHGRHHSGIDVDLDVGDTVRSLWSGKVRYAKYNDGGFGNLVIVRHYNGLETFYAHFSKILVSPDQDVKAGDVLGLGGNTGRSYGAHLHLEIRFFDASINPEEIIDFTKRECKDENLFVHKGLFRPGAKPTDTINETEGGAEIAEHLEAPVRQIRQERKKYYKVRSGDTLSEIADRNQTTISKICQLNGIRPTTTIQIGKSIRVH